MTQAQNAATTTPDATPVAAPTAPRWRVADVVALFALPFNDLLFRAQQVHREHFDANAVQLSTLLSIKTGGCEEDCGYCSQSSHHDTGLKAEKLMDVDAVLDAARAAKASGASRFCMGAAWRNPKERHMEPLAAMVRGVKEMGLETCMTLGMLEDAQAQQLADAGLDYYNHNLDTSPEFYGQIISTRSYQERLDTLDRVRDAGINVCCGGIIGMGESRRERAGLIAQLANLNPYPDSVPINNLVAIEGTPLDRCRADHDAEGDGAAVRRPRAARRRDAGAVLPRRRELDVLRRPAADDQQPADRARPQPVRAARHQREPVGAARRGVVMPARRAHPPAHAAFPPGPGRTRPRGMASPMPARRRARRPHRRAHRRSRWPVMRPRSASRRYPANRCRRTARAANRRSATRSTASRTAAPR